MISTNSSIKVSENEQQLSLSGTFLIADARSSENMSLTSVVDDSVGAYALMRVSGPADEWNCRDRILSLPTVGGTMDLSRVFLTAKPTTPCSLVSFNGFPSQKNEKFFFL